VRRKKVDDRLMACVVSYVVVRNEAFGKLWRVFPTCGRFVTFIPTVEDILFY
jgi:hypothetical protein